MPRKKYSYDPACEDLAERFLVDMPERIDARDLAQAIQDTIEGFLSGATQRAIASADDALVQADGAAVVRRVA